MNFAFNSIPNNVHAEEKQARLEGELKCKSEEIGRVTKRTVAYRTVVAIRLSRSFGFPTCLFLASPLSGPHERCPMASRKEQLSSLFFVAWTTQPLHEKLSMGFRRAKVTQRNTNRQKNIFVDDRFRGHHPRAWTNQNLRKHFSCRRTVQLEVQKVNLFFIHSQSKIHDCGQVAFV